MKKGERLRRTPAYKSLADKKGSFFNTPIRQCAPKP